VDHETQVRSNRRLERNLKTAKLRASACVEDIDFRAPRGIDRSVVLTLASSQWVTSHQNLLIVGPTGAGTTFLACALAHAAVRAGHTHSTCARRDCSTSSPCPTVTDASPD
jgi:DNA replication protein DnaC